MSPDYAKQIGADGYAADAASAVELFQRLIAEQDAAAGRGSGRGSRRFVTAAVSRATPAHGTLTIDGVTGPARPGQTLFDCAEAHGRERAHLVRQAGQVPRVPGRGRGRRRAASAARRPQEQPPRRPLPSRLPDARIVEPGEVRCHTLRRGALRIETETEGLDESRRRSIRR